MAVSKEITRLAQTDMFNEDIKECRHQTTNLKTWANYNTFFHWAHSGKMRVVTTAGKGGYTVVVKIIYGVPPPPSEDHHKEIDNLNNIIQGMQTHNYELEGLAQSI